MSYEGEGLEIYGDVACRGCGVVIGTILDDLGQPMRDLCQECEDRCNMEEVEGEAYGLDTYEGRRDDL